MPIPIQIKVAADIIAQKYFRKAGVPAFVKKVEEKNKMVLRYIFTSMIL